MSEAAALGLAEWIDGLRRLALPPGAPVVAHASLAAFGRTQGGAETVVEALLAVIPALLAPTFTYQTMLYPEVGPAYNGMTYGVDDARNRLARFFDSQMPADRLMGAVPEALRRRPEARRSVHPILSFAGVGVDAALAAQTLADPLAPLQALHDAGGWALLLGVDHSVNTSIHLGERLAGRAAFLRWALTPQGAAACPGFPGCSDGFGALAGRFSGERRVVRIGMGSTQAFYLPDLIRSVQAALAADPAALLCDRSYCERCDDSRHRLRSPGWNPAALAE